MPEVIQDKMTDHATSIPQERKEEHQNQEQKESQYRQQAKAVQQAKKAAALQLEAALTKWRKDHQTSLAQKAEEASRLEAAAALLLTTTSAQVNDVCTERIVSQNKETVQRIKHLQRFLPNQVARKVSSCTGNEREKLFHVLLQKTHLTFYTFVHYCCTW